MTKELLAFLLIMVVGGAHLCKMVPSPLFQGVAFTVTDCLRGLQTGSEIPA